MSAIWPDLESPFMEAVRRSDETHDGQPVFDVINRREKSVLAVVFWYRPWARFCCRANSDQVVFSDDCLDALSAFCRALTKAARERAESVVNSE